MSSLPHILPSSFFKRSVLKVARELIGCYLVRKQGTNVEKFIITETEAYDGIDDLACHASKGRTKRTEIMFGEAGYLYVYLVYGMHWMLNIVTGPKDYPSAVLIRGVSGYQGPAKLTKRLNITGKLNGQKLGEEIWIERVEEKIAKEKILQTPRVGVEYAGPIWSKKEWRFVLVDSDK